MCLTESAFDHSLHHKSVHEYANSSVYDYVYICMKFLNIIYVCIEYRVLFSFFFCFQILLLLLEEQVMV